MRVESTPVRRDRDGLDALLVLCAQGDQAAFASVYDAVLSRAHDLSVRVLRDRTLAEDATHEAFIHVWRCASRFDPSKRSAQAWILAIVYRTAVDRIRPTGAPAPGDKKHTGANRGDDCDLTSDPALQHIDAERGRSAQLLRGGNRYRGRRNTRYRLKYDGVAIRSDPAR